MTPPPATSRFPDEWALKKSHPVKGEVTTEEMLLHCCDFGRNSFKTHAIGSIYPAENGSRIVGRFGVHPQVWLVQGCWFGLLLLIGVPGFVHLTRGLLSGAITWGELWNKPYSSELGPFGMIAAGVLVNLLGRSQFGHESSTIKRFLIQVLEAREEQPPKKSLL